MPSGHDWLPLDTLTGSGVAARLSSVVQAWSTDWIAGRQVELERLEVVAPGRGWDNAWQARNPWLATKASDKGLHRLRNRALDFEPEHHSPPTPADSKVLAAFETRLIDDLVARLTKLINPPSLESGDLRQIGEHGGISFDIGEGLASIALPVIAVTPLVRAGLLPAPKAAALVGRVQAAETTSLNVEGLLGQARITLGELQGLTVGDVLLLDRDLSSHAVLALADGTVIGQAKLAEQDQCLALILQ